MNGRERFRRAPGSAARSSPTARWARCSSPAASRSGPASTSSPTTRPELIGAIHREYLDGRRRADRDGDVRGEPGPAGRRSGWRTRRAASTGAAPSVAREARDVAGRDALVAGSIGPLGAPTRDLLHLDEAGSATAFREQIDGLLEGGVDLFILETFVDLRPPPDRRRRGAPGDRRPADRRPAHVRRGARARRTGRRRPRRRRRSATRRSTSSGSTAAPGRTPASRRSRRSAPAGAPARPARSIMPNAGLPQRIEGQFVYAAGPEYFGRDGRRGCSPPGAAIVGGCCGTTPEHIAAMRAALDALAAADASGRRRAPAARPHRSRRRPRPTVRRDLGRADRARRPPATPPPPTPLARAAPRRPLRRLGRDRPAALDPDRPDDRGRPAPPRRRRRPRQRQRLGDGPRPDGRAGGRVRDPARPRPRVPRPLHDPRPEPHGDRVGAARRPRARRPQHPRPDRRPAAGRRLPDRHRRLGRRLDRARRDPGPAQPRRGRGRLARSASRPASRSPAPSTRRPPTPRPSGTASSASSPPARTWS